MRTRTILLSILVGLLIWLGFFVFSEPEYSGSLTITEEGPLLFAHRGFGNHAPDNSLVGAEEALELGFAGVDVDAQLTKDDEIVIFHDVSIERFTTGEGRVDSYTLDELQTYDLGDRFGDGTEYEDVQMATFADFVARVTPEALLMVELKIATTQDTGMEQQVIEIIEQYDAFERVYISAFNPVVINRLERLDERVQTVFIFQDSGWDPDRVAETKEEDRVALPWYLQTEWTRRVIRKLVQPDALSINQHVDESVIDRLQERGWPVFLWSLNTEAEVEWGVQKSPYGIVTDEPILTKAVVDGV